MLVVSRRSNQRLSFPEVGITVHFLRVTSGTAKVGIDAPPQISIVRNESAPDNGKQAQVVLEELLGIPKHMRHSIRNELQTISIGVHLLREQQKLDLQEEAEETFSTIKESLSRLDENRALKSPQSRKKDAVNKTVLVIEDEDNERELLAGLLRLKGYNVSCVKDGGAALDYLSENSPAAILVDMGLPTHSGAFVVRHIKHSKHLENSRVFAVSGSTPEENDIPIGRTGVDRWFPKPVNVGELVNALSHSDTGRGDGARVPA